MPRALRLQAVTLPVPDLAAAEKFYRWVLAMKAGAGDPVEGAASLGWGKEDRIRLVDASDPDAREVIELRIEASTPVETAGWLNECGLVPTGLLAAAGDEDELGALWPGVPLEVDADPAGSNRFVVSLAAPADVRVDLHVPLTAASVVERGRQGPFDRRSKDWTGLENPGLLGVTLGAADPRESISFLERFGIATMTDPDALLDEPGSAAPGDRPLLAGDHQIRVEERDPPGLYGTACMVAASRLPDLVRTLERFGVPHRHERNHLLAVDPAGRILAVNGVRSG
jgi:catechol 2,3-dioxygenase-like lactoylglutathione lyase family enzyme